MESDNKKNGITRKAGVLLILAVVGRGWPATAQSRGTFTATGQMTTARAWHTATLLHNGKVLIAGGETSTPQVLNPASPLATTELYDVAAGAFSPAGEMATPRRGHTATLLPDGRVLIAGGYGAGHAVLSTAELYDSSTGAFTDAGTMIGPHVSHTATLLQDGRVLISGGFASANGTPANAELYDPSSGAFAAAAAYAAPMNCDFCAPATLLANGKVLLMSPAQLFDPAAGVFSGTGSPIYYAHSTSTLLTDGKVLLTGGEAEGRSASAELYDPLSGTFQSTSDMASKRVWQAATLLPDGKALITGGESEHCAGNACVFSGSVASAELYDPATGTFTPAGDMTASREVHTATLLSDGRVLIAGGVAYGGIGAFSGSLATAEFYEPAALQAAPVLLSISRDGPAQGAILHADTHKVVSASNPASAGEYLEIYGTGLSEASVIPPQVAIGGRSARVLYFGQAPGFARLNQVNVQAPRGVAAGPALPVRLTYMGRPSNEVTIAVQ